MNTATDLADRYIAIWNETDTGRRRALIAQTWTEDAVYLDPLMHAEGRAAIETLTGDVQTKFPTFYFRRTSEVDSHNGRLRFSWELGPEGGPAFAGGIDFGVIVGERLQSITGFLDFAPAPAGS